MSQHPAPRLGMRSGPIVARIAAEHGVTVSDITGGGRSRKVSAARQAAMYALRSEAAMSLPQIATAIGRKDHATILHGIHAHCERTGIPLPQGMASTGHVERKRQAARKRALRWWRGRHAA